MQKIFNFAKTHFIVKPGFSSRYFSNSIVFELKNQPKYTIMIEAGDNGDKRKYKLKNLNQKRY